MLSGILSYYATEFWVPDTTAENVRHFVEGQFIIQL